VRRVPLSNDESLKPALDHRQAVRVAELALQVERYYGTPQDVEWAIDRSGELYLLQCRPLAASASPNTSPFSGQHDPSPDGMVLCGGITASPGVAYGPVFLVDKGSDLLRFPKGSVLVVHQALPKWAPLLGQASALLTSQGSFAGHLASVAREFGVPALFELPGLFEQLKNGESITVDAVARCVYRGRREVALSATVPRPSMIDSPVFQSLTQVSRLITPLNLLDPASSEFTPANCRTLHDLTRFIHEKSVQEMFNFGKSHHFSERSSKQLVYKVPMQWWILNLDDGFTAEIAGKYVTLENIACAPMLAFWEGFAAIPWDGPPPLDGKGFMSVLFQSTTTNALVPMVRSKFADRNYFIISKNYCNLSSRLGYHFALLEALVSTRTTENYVTYQFKGGAADDQRRIKRVCFIGDILEAHGFNVDIRQDNLIARIENRPAEYLLERLKILGYLSLHTRQLDMIMSNPAKVGYYRAKLDKDISTILAGPAAD
jgi:pyruvate,water dikinase